jgi:hypothetical protein
MLIAIAQKRESETPKRRFVDAQSWINDGALRCEA